MRIRTIAWIAAVPFVAVLGTAFAASPGPQAAPPVHGKHAVPGHDKKRGGNLQERYLYVSTIAQSATDPDFIAVIGADPRRRDFGKIVNRVDMPNVGDELHHYGYSHDQKRLLVPGLFSSRIHVFDIKGDGKRMNLSAVNDKLAAKSGYVVPHGVMAMSHGRAMVTMIGAATGNDAARRHRRDRRQDGSVRRPLRAGGRPCSRRAGPEVHVRLRVAARGEPRHQHDVRPAGAVRRRHRAELPRRRGRRLGPPPAEGDPDRRSRREQRGADGALHQAARASGGRSSTRRAPTRSGWPTTTTATASSSSSRCSARMTDSCSRPTRCCPTTASTCT